MNWHARLAAARGQSIEQRSMRSPPKPPEGSPGSPDELPKLPQEGIGSFGGDPAAREENISIVRAVLSGLASVHAIDELHVHQLSDLDLEACIGLNAHQLYIYLGMLVDTAARRAGRAPEGHTAEIQCHQCGPVLVHPGLAKALPVIAGSIRALACPWCFFPAARKWRLACASTPSGPDIT